MLIRFHLTEITRRKMKRKNAAKRCKYKKNRQSQRIDGLLILAQKEGFEPYMKNVK